MLGLQFAVARNQSSFVLLVFLGVPCIGRTSASTSLLRSSYKQCYAFHMQRMNTKLPVCPWKHIYKSFNDRLGLSLTAILEIATLRMTNVHSGIVLHNPQNPIPFFLRERQATRRICQFFKEAVPHLYLANILDYPSLVFQLILHQSGKPRRLPLLTR